MIEAYSQIEALTASSYRGPVNDFAEFAKNAVEQSISQRFEEQAEKYPDRIAVKTVTERLTYRDLNQRANRLARVFLSRSEARRPGPVALLLEKSAPLVAASLGVLKSGRLQFFLDPLFPRARIDALLADAQASYILTNERNLPLARELAGGGCEVLVIDEHDSHFDASNLGLPLAPHAPAYLLYTSGSTGTPKGVILEHRTLLHRVMRQTNSFRICADDRLSHLASFGTGQGLVNIYCALLNGAALCPLDVKAEGLGRLASWLTEEEITIYRSSASVFRYFVETLTPGRRFPKLRLVRLASEQVTKRDIELCKKHFSPPCIFVNGLSTSETGVVREFFMNHETTLGGHHVPVGGAVSDVKILLLDEKGEEVAPGEPGEIAVQSRYLSPGYWRKPELTRRAFLPAPGGGDERIYLTGDLGQMLPGGLLVHLGRKDFQVKIRGHRVEVAEIEAALSTHAAVREAVVMAREDARGDQSLVAYLVFHPKVPRDATAVRYALAEKLPDYMMPAAFVVLDAMPLTPGGKVDRLALASLNSDANETSPGDYAPRTDTEKVLAQIWSRILFLDDVNREANFFFTGGHSLLATQVVSRINAIFQIALPLVTLFETPVLADLAVAVEELIMAEIEAMSEEEAEHLLRSNGAFEG